MTKKEFQIRIDKANELLLEKHVYEYYDYVQFKHVKINRYENGVCWALGDAFNFQKTFSEQKVCQDFEQMYSGEKGRKRGGFWLGKRREYNLERRQIALRLFEQYAIDNKLYKEY